jgi:hypothetical protein
MIRALMPLVLATVGVCTLLAVETWAHPAWGIVVDRNNQIYFSDLETIWKIDAQGKLTIFRAGVSGRHIHELTIDEEGNLYGADYSYEPSTQRYINAIWKMTPAGGFSYLVAPTYELPKGMSIVRDRDANTYYVEQNNHLKRETLLLKRTPGAGVSVLAGSSYGHLDGKGNRARFSSIVGMAFGPDGSLYVADNDSVRRVAMDGTVTTVGNDLVRTNPNGNGVEGEVAWGGLMGLAVNPQGDAYVADYRNRRVLKVTHDGAVSTVASAEQRWSPTGVAYKDGNLYILEFTTVVNGDDKPHVRKLSADGKLTMLAAIGANENATASENPAADNSERRVASSKNVLYLLIAAGALGLALAFTIWRVRRKMLAHRLAE